MKHVKLTATQAAVIRGAQRITVNGRTTVKTQYVRGANINTYRKLVDLGLTTSVGERADLTGVGMVAWLALNANPDRNSVLTGPPSVVAAVECEAIEEADADTAERYVVQPVRLGFAVVDTVTGKPQARMGSRYAANDMAERLNMAAGVQREWDKSSVGYAHHYGIGAAQMSGRVPDVSGFGCEDPSGAMLDRLRTQVMQMSGGAFLGTVAEAVSPVRYEGGDPVAFVDRVRAFWPQGTRVSVETDQGVRTGTVDGHDVYYVTRTDHPNYGRSYVGVTWDSNTDQSGRWLGHRSRPFTDEMTRI